MVKKKISISKGLRDSDKKKAREARKGLIRTNEEAEGNRRGEKNVGGMKMHGG